MVFQTYAPYPHITVAENIGFSLEICNTPDEEIKRRVIEIAERLGIVGERDRKPKQLSGGQRQRVAMGRAIVREPKVLLMDEPLSILERRSQIVTSLICVHIILSYVVRARVFAFERGWARNRVLLLTTATNLGLQVLAFETPLICRALSVHSLGLAGWLRVGAAVMTFTLLGSILARAESAASKGP